MSPEKKSARILLKIQPNSSRNELAGINDGIPKIKIAAPPVKGKANRELIDFLAKLLGINRRGIVILSGHTTRNKLVGVSGLNKEEVLAKLG